MSHRKLFTWLLTLALGLFLSWLILVPLTLTVVYHGEVGTAPHGGQMVIECVEPWPMYPFWCYYGQWIRPSEKFILPDGSTIYHTGTSFYGRAFINYLDLFLRVSFESVVIQVLEELSRHVRAQ